MANGFTLPRPEPDWQRLVRALDGEEIPSRPPVFEYFADAEIMRAVVEGMLGRKWISPVAGDRASFAAYLDNYIAFWYHLGYDTVHYFTGMSLPSRTIGAANTAQAASRERHWADEHTRQIQSWEDFERYPWPRPGQADYFPLEYLSRHLPEGMGLTAEHNSHIVELTINAFTYEGLALALYDQPDLVLAVTERIAGLLERFFETIADLPNLVAFLTGDDMGFRSGTFVSPDDMRRYFLPSHARIAQIAHEHGKRHYLHACGNLSTIMEDLIESVGIDGKHSFEDAIQPVEDFHRRYHDRIASLGGVDVDVLARGSVDDVRRRTREIIDACAPLGRFALGSGNSVTNYIPLENYLAMLGEARLGC